MQRKERPNEVLLGLAIALLIIASVAGLIFLKEFIGWFYHSARAGSITGIVIHHTYTADAWHGFAGVALLDYENNQTNWNATVPGGNTTIHDFSFNCFGKSGFDIYASTVPASQLSLSTVQAATAADVDAFIGINTSERISATQTYNETFTINFGGSLITGPGLRTKSSSANNTFHQVALKDGNGNLLFGANATIGTLGFDGQIHNYQFMVPVPYNTTTITYYFFPDPMSDPLGSCSGKTYGRLIGYVNDSTNGTSLEDVTVHVADSSTDTNSTGWYDFFAETGTKAILAIKAGYRDYVNFTSITESVINQHNFSMIPLSNETTDFPYGYISGYVFYTNGTPMENATVMTGIFSNVTGSSGQYSIISLAGNDTILIATRTGYQTNVSYVNVTPLNTLEFNITLQELPVQFGPNGTVYGKVYDGETNETLENATVYIGSWMTVTNSTGDYNISIPSYEFYYVIAIKEFYDPAVLNFSGNRSVTSDSLINQDIHINKSNLLTGLFDQPPESAVPPTPLPQAPEALTNETEKVLTQPGEENGTGLVIKDEAGKIAAYLSIRQIKTHIKQDSFVEQTLAFYNFQDKPISVNLEVEGDVTDIFDTSENTMQIASNDYGEVAVTIMGTKPPGLYTGMLHVGGDITTTLPIEIRISKEGKIPIKTLMMKLDVLNKDVVQGTPVKYKLDLVNLFTDRKYQVDLTFYVASLNGTKLTNFTQKSIMLETFTSLVGQVEIPADFEPGDYVVRAQADYLGLSSSTDALFSVREPFYQYDLLGIIPVWLLATLLALVATSVFAGQEIKRRQEAKKRFHTKVEYDMLPQEGDRSLFVGKIAETNKNSYIDMDILTVHSIVAGSTGGGKSISAQDIVEEALLKGVAVAVFDPTAQWSGMLRKLEDKKFLEFYPKFGMDPKKSPKAFNGNIKAVKNGREIIDIFKYLRPGEIQIFTTNTLDPKDYDIFVASMIQQIFHSKLDEFRGLKYMIVFDEIHRILPKFGGSGAGFTQIERGCREFRKWGIGIVLISQVLSDFVGEIKANINTLIQMKTRDEGDLSRIKMQYGEEYIQSLVKSPVGSGMVQNGAWNRGKPYYVTFRPILHSVVRLTDEELDKYNHFNEIVEQLEYELEQLEGMKQDVFDLKLELKLAKDKIKSGNFNMVQIYLDGLTPRVQKMWDKMGQKPKKLEIQLLDTSEIDAAVAKAKAEKAAQEKTGAGAGQVAEKPEETPAAQAVKQEQAQVQPTAPAAASPKTQNTDPASLAPQSTTSRFTTLVSTARQAVTAKNRAAATQAYNQLAAVYKQMPQQQKPLALRHITDIKNRIIQLK